jgi:hypothetical protein
LISRQVIPKRAVIFHPPTSYDMHGMPQLQECLQPKEQKIQRKEGTEKPKEWKECNERMNNMI